MLNQNRVELLEGFIELSVRVVVFIACVKYIFGG